MGKLLYITVSKNSTTYDVVLHYETVTKYCDLRSYEETADLIRNNLPITRFNGCAKDFII